MDKIYEDLSIEEKRALIEACKEDPVIFLETILKTELLEYQKVYVREVFKALKSRINSIEEHIILENHINVECVEELERL